MAAKSFKDGSAALPSHGVTRQQLIDWVQHQQHEDGTMAQALEGLTAAGVLKVTGVADGLKSATTAPMTSQAEQLLAAGTPSEQRLVLDNVEVLTTDGEVSAAVAVTVLEALSGSFTMTLANGTAPGQRKIVVAKTTGTAVWVITGAFAGFASATFGEITDAKGYSLMLEWDGAAWHWVGGNATIR